MPWNERIREAAYTSPTGTRILFSYENVSKTVDKKTTAFEFPDADGTYIQDLGHAGRRYPMRLFFWGDDYDQEADAFEAALLERGAGKLDHPIYGVIDVVPFGTITRRDDLKTAANQAIIELTFWETIGLIYPTPQDDPAASVLGAVAAYNTAAAEAFANETDLTGAVAQATTKSGYSKLLDSASAGLQSIADTQADVQKQFEAVNDSINQGIDVLIAQPLTLAFQTLQMLQSPARALTSIEARLTAYGDLATSLVTGNGAAVSAVAADANAFRTSDLYVSTYVTGSVLSVVNNEFLTKTDALEAADAVLAQLDEVVVWRDANLAALAEIDTGEAYQKLQEAVAITAGFLVGISFSLKQERSIVLTEPRTIIDLAAEIYGSVDDQLDFLITSNNLTGSEILELPKGREVVYYV